MWGCDGDADGWMVGEEVFVLFQGDILVVMLGFVVVLNSCCRPEASL
jgi:hypothetical protein